MYSLVRSQKIQYETVDNTTFLYHEEGTHCTEMLEPTRDDRQAKVSCSSDLLSMQEAQKSCTNFSHKVTINATAKRLVQKD